MKNILITLFVLFGTFSYAQQDLDSQWRVNPNNNLELNYQLLNQEFAKGVLYGTAGFSLGMWLSGNKTGWGIVGSLLTVNIPILLDKRHKQQEVLIGRNVGAMVPALTLTVSIELTRKGKMKWRLPHYLKKH